MADLATVDRPLHIAIIGSGPSGFYAAAALLDREHTYVDLFDKLPAPYGLVRYGVAPDHQKIKNVARLYAKTAASERVRFFGNVRFGHDLRLADLQRHYDAVLFAVGSEADRKLGVPGEDLVGSLSATAFVAWYNGHPDYFDLAPDLSAERVVVIGAGNVALDVARILVRAPDELAKTDIADTALDALRASNVRDVYLVARRGPAQVKFTLPEIKEFQHLQLADVVVDPADLDLGPASQRAVNADRQLGKMYGLLQSFAETPLSGKPRRVHFLFRRAPIEITGDNGRVAGIRLERNRLEEQDDGYVNAVRTGEIDVLEADLVLRAVGYRGIPLPDVPYDEKRGKILNEEGRVLSPETGRPHPGLYVVGWAKRGPSGVIGTNKPDAGETVDHLFDDLPDVVPAPEPDRAAIPRLLTERGVRYFAFEDWLEVDRVETEAGAGAGRPRIKFTRLQEMLACLSR